jgi:acetyl esterase/lipase
MDIYYPPDRTKEDGLPAVVFVSGYSDPGFERMVGCKLKDMESYISWGQLTAASGLVAVTYTNTDPAVDIQSVLQYIRQNAESLRIDPNRLGIWACSGNVPNALAVLMEGDRDYLKCAVLCYGIMMDVDGSDTVAQLSRTFGFVNPAIGKSVDDLPTDLPLFIVRAGQDQMPHLNETIDSFLAAALKINLPVTLVNFPSAPHAFDVMHDTEASRQVIRQILTFMRFHLLN